MPKRKAANFENPAHRMVIDGGVFMYERHLRHEKLAMYESQVVALDPNFDVELERITSWTVKSGEGLPICEVAWPPEGDEDER